MPCLDGNVLQALVEGTLSPEELARAHEHLDACALCRRLAAVVAGDASLSSTAARTEPLTTAGAGLAPPPADPPTSSQFGRYFVIGPLGQGGMGRVYLAYDPKLDRKVALKRVRAGSQLHPGARARLLREAQAMARLSHPNVLAVHDADEMGDEVFIAMEYVQGRTLRRWLKEPRTWSEILALFCAAGEGLAAAHRAGLVHRDFKPDNVLVGEDGRVRVTDFGLARSREPRDLDPEQRPPSSGAFDEAPGTEAGALSGTPGYIAPEALRGEQGPLSDQFSFFVSLYEALFGERPFQGPSLVAQLGAANRGQLRPARRRRGVPKWLQRLVLIGLAPEPARRFPSMADALAALRRASRRSRRRRQVAAAALGLAAIAGAGFSLARRPERLCAGSERYLAGTWDEAGRQRVRAAFASTRAPQAEATFQQAARALDAWARGWVAMRTKVCIAARVVGEQSMETMGLRMRCLDRRWMDFEALVRRLSAPGEVPLQQAVKSAASLPSLFECENPASLTAHAGEGGAAAARSDELRRKLAEARAHQLTRAVKPGLELAEEVERQARALGFHALRAEALLIVARLRDESGDFTGAEESQLEALSLAQAHGLDALVAQASTGLMAIVGGRLSRFEEAHRWEKLAWASIERSGLIGQEQEARFFNNLGGVAMMENSHQLALQSFKRALALRERLVGGPEHVLADTLYNLCLECIRAGRLDEAVGYAKRSLALRERLLGSEHRDVAETLSALGRIAVGKGEMREGLSLNERAVALAERTLPENHPNQAFFLFHLAQARVAAGDFPGAEKAFENALAIQRTRSGPTNPSEGLLIAKLAAVAALRGDYRKAIELVEKVARGFPELEAEALGDLGEAYRRAGRLDEARRALERALHRLREKPDDGVEVHILTRLAQCELSRGQRAKARERLERALDLGVRTQLLPQDLAQTRLALALALPSLEAARARDLAWEARAWFEATGRDAELRQANQFLATSAAGPP